MKKLFVFILVATICITGLSAQAESSDSLKFVETKIKVGNAIIEFSFNEMTGVLRLTYTLEHFSFDLGEADTQIRTAVAAFADEHGFFKYRLYPEEDDVRYFAKTRTTRYKKFYILYDQDRLKGSF